MKDMQLPPDMLRELDDYCRERKYHKAAQRASAEEDIKLQHFFGGQDIGYMRTAQGLVVVVAGDLASPEFGEVLDRMSREERRQIILWSPWKWNDPVGELGVALDEL